jgi:WD40 repeat protein
MRQFDQSKSLFLTPDGSRIIGTVRDELVTVDPTTGKVVGRVNREAKWSELCELSADGTRGVTEDVTSLVVWDLVTGKELFTVPGAATHQITARLSADGRYLTLDHSPLEIPATGGPTLPVYDVNAKKLVAELVIAHNTRGEVRLSADGSTAVTWGRQTDNGGGDAKGLGRRVQVWNVRRERATSVELPGDDNVRSAAISPDGDRIAVAGGDGTISLLDATGKVVVSLLALHRVGADMWFSPDGKTLAAAARDGTMQLWDVEKGRSLGVCPSPVLSDRLIIESVRFPAAGKAIALAQRNASAVVWEVPSGKVLSPDELARSVSGVAFADADREVLCSSGSHEVGRWSTAGKRLGTTRLARPRCELSIYPNHDRTDLLMTATEPRLLVQQEFSDDVTAWDVSTGEERFRLANLFNVAVAATPDGKTLVVAGAESGSSKSGWLSVIDPTAGTRTRAIKLPAEDVLAVTVTPDGKLAAVVQGEGQAVRLANDPDRGKTTLRGFDLSSGEPLPEVSFDRREYKALLAAAPDKVSVVLTFYDRTVSEYNLKTGKHTRTLLEADMPVSATPVFSGDGKRMALAAEHNKHAAEIHVLNWPDGAMTHKFLGHCQAVTCLAFSKDGKTLASGCADTTVLLWDLSKEK